MEKWLSTNNSALMIGASVLAFLVAAVLVIMIFRMLFGGRLRMPGGRARQARLGIVDAFDLDRQRQLIIVRRDNTEHLIMIGGPNDVVIESEIVRAEARDLRDQRREPGSATIASDGRIPAPLPTPDKGPQPRPVEEPMLPMPLPPEPGAGEPAGEAPRAPTFPLPPRRPIPPAPERRPAVPPKLPESVSRGDEVPALSGQPPAPAPAPPAPVPVPPPIAAKPAPQPVPPIPAAPSAPPPAQATPATPTTARPPFLKPLPPRPAIRPLQRTTPQPGSAAPSPAPAPPKPPASGAPAAGSPAPKPSQPSQPAPEPAGDGLESLEQEMAKLLGRGG